MSKTLAELNEKEIKEMAEDIVNSLVRLSLGETPGMLSNSVFKNLQDHSRLTELMIIFKEFLSQATLINKSADDWRRITDMRLKLVECYLKG